MLCRSTSTGVLSSLLPLVSSHVQPGIYDQHDRSAPDLCNHHYSPAHVSAPRSGIQSPASHYFRPSVDCMSRSTDGGDWEFEVGSGNKVLSRPRFRKVQSENDLQSLWRTSSGSSATFAAAESFNSSASSQVYDDDRVQLGNLDRISSECESAILEMSENSEDMSSASSEVSEEPREAMLMLGNGSYWNERMTKVGKQSLSSQEEFRSSAFPLDDVGGSVSTRSKSCESSAFRHTSSIVDNTYSLHSSVQDPAAMIRNMSVSTLQASTWGAVMERSAHTLTSSQTETDGPMLITDIGCGSGKGGGGKGVSGGRGGSGGGHGDSHGVEAQYRRMLEADPGNPLLLRNFAQFLHEVKRDPLKAEPYYERAILANPRDGEVLGRYAQLIWEVYKDEDRAGGYFDQALQACPDDCYLNAAYASFLWSSEGDHVDEAHAPVEVSHSNGVRYINNVTPVYGAAAHA